RGWPRPRVPAEGRTALALASIEGGHGGVRRRARAESDGSGHLVRCRTRVADPGPRRPRSKDGRSGVAARSDLIAGSRSAVREPGVGLISSSRIDKYRDGRTRNYLPRPRAGIRMAVKIRRRARLRRKEATDFLGRLADEFGMDVTLDDVTVVEAEEGPHRLFLSNTDAISILFIWWNSN